MELVHFAGHFSRRRAGKGETFEAPLRLEPSAAQQAPPARDHRPVVEYIWNDEMEVLF